MGYNEWLSLLAGALVSLLLALSLFASGKEIRLSGMVLSFLVAAGLSWLICNTIDVLEGVRFTPSPSTARTPAPLLPTPGDSITWGEDGPCYTLDGVQPSSDGTAWVWMHRCGRPAEKPTILTVEEWRRHALPRATTPTHIED